MCPACLIHVPSFNNLFHLPVIVLSMRCFTNFRSVYHIVANRRLKYTLFTWSFVDICRPSFLLCFPHYRKVIQIRVYILVFLIKFSGPKLYLFCFNYTFPTCFCKNWKKGYLWNLFNFLLSSLTYNDWFKSLVQEKFIL